MMDFGNVISSAFSYFGGESRNASQEHQAREANAFTADQFARRYQITTADMQAAGLNPMLAYQQGGGSPSTGQQAAMQDTITPAVNTYMQNKLNSAQVANVEADTYNKRAQADLIQAQTQDTGASADQRRTNIGLMEHQARQIVESVKNIPKEGDRLTALAKQLAESADLMRKQGATQEQITNQTRWLAVKAMHDSDLAGLVVDAAKSFDNIGREAKQLQPIIELLKGLARTRR